MTTCRRAFRLLLTYPFPNNAQNTIKGDFTNLWATLDTDLDTIAGNLGVGKPPDPAGRPRATAPLGAAAVGARALGAPPERHGAVGAGPAPPDDAAGRTARCEPVRFGRRLGRRGLVVHALPHGRLPMITRTVRLQAAAFALLSVALVAILSANYVGLTDKIAGGAYVVSADLAQSGGIFVGAEVTYRGVTVGKVEGMRLSGDGVVVDARLDRGTEVPKDTKAVVENRSAVGEQYLDLQPRTARAPYLASGDVIPRDRTAFPLRIDRLLQHVDDTVSSVPRDALVTTVDEPGRGVQGWRLRPAAAHRLG